MSYPGAEGAARMRAIMKRLRERPPAEIAGLAVTGVVDYLVGVPMPVTGGCGGASPQRLPSAGVVEFRLGGGGKLIVRPSGTEPKVKAYLFSKAGRPDEADALLAELESAARELLS